ncbi:MAG: hypothetical protein V3V71_04690, partial [Roseateles sp.]
MAGSTKTRIRRKRVREQRAESTISWWERFRATVGLWPALMCLVFASVATGIALYGRQLLDYSVGQKIDQPIIAQVDFEWINEAQTEQDRQRARAAAPSFYKTNHTLINDIGLATQTLYQDAMASETFEAFAAAAEPRGWTVDQALFGELRKLVNEQGGEAYAKWVDNLRTGLRTCYTFRPADSRARQPEASGPTVSILTRPVNPPEGAEPQPVALEAVLLYPVANADQMQRLAGELASEAGFPMPTVQPAIRDLLSQRLQAEPLLLYDKALTQEAMQKAAAEVKPAVISYTRGQPIVSPTHGSEEVVLTAEHLSLLEADAEQYRA